MLLSMVQYMQNKFKVVTKVVIGKLFLVGSIVISNISVFGRKLFS